MDKLPLLKCEPRTGLLEIAGKNCRLLPLGQKSQAEILVSIVFHKHYTGQIDSVKECESFLGAKLAVLPQNHQKLCQNFG